MKRKLLIAVLMMALVSASVLAVTTIKYQFAVSYSGFGYDDSVIDGKWKTGMTIPEEEWWQVALTSNYVDHGADKYIWRVRHEEGKNTNFKIPDSCRVDGMIKTTVIMLSDADGYLDNGLQNEIVYSCYTGPQPCAEGFEVIEYRNRPWCSVKAPEYVPGQPMSNPINYCGTQRMASLYIDNEWYCGRPQQDHEYLGHVNGYDTFYEEMMIEKVYD